MCGTCRGKAVVIVVNRPSLCIEIVNFFAMRPKEDAGGTFIIDAYLCQALKFLPKFVQAGRIDMASFNLPIF